MDGILVPRGPGAGSAVTDLPAAGVPLTSLGARRDLRDHRGRLLP